MTSYSQATESMQQSASQHVATISNRLKGLSESDDEPVKTGKPLKAEQVEKTSSLFKLEAGQSKTEESDDGEMASKLENLAKVHGQVDI